MTVPRITPHEVEANIVSTEYILLPDGRTTICMLTLKNGFTVRGEASCVSIENYDAAVGRKISRENAVHKVWPLMGYALADRLYRERTSLLHELNTMDPKTLHNELYGSWTPTEQEA